MSVLYHKSLVFFHSCSSFFAADSDELTLNEEGEYKREKPSRKSEVMVSGKYEKCRAQGSFLLTVTIHVIIQDCSTHANGRTLSKQERPEMGMGSG